MEVGDNILSVNHRPVTDDQVWFKHLEWLVTHETGLCVKSTDLEANTTMQQYPCDFKHCCGNIQSSLCFLVPLKVSKSIEQTPELDGLEKPCNLEREFTRSNLRGYYRFFKARGESFVDYHRKACFSVRDLIQISHEHCDALGKCSPTYYGSSQCLLPYSNHSTIRLIILSLRDKQDIIFFGPASEVYHTVIVSRIRPLWPGLLPLGMYNQWVAFLGYVFSISYTLLLFNLLPFTTFDGYHIFSLTIDALFGNLTTKKTRRRIISAANTFSAFLISTIIMIAIFHLRRSFF